MGVSWNTELEGTQAERGIARSADGTRKLPPIITRKPRRGDIHPVAASMLEKFLAGTQTQYLYGLKRIELRARRSGEIGEPFGCYLFRERTIVLYSLPWHWALKRLSAGWERELIAYGATVEHGATISVRWASDAANFALWFWDQVVMHELGHHFVEQYRSKNGRVRSRKAHEALANLHVGRYLNRRWQRWQQREASAAICPIKPTN